MIVIDYLGKIWKRQITYYTIEGTSGRFNSENYDFSVYITGVANNPKIVKQEIDYYVEMYQN